MVKRGQLSTWTDQSEKVGKEKSTQKQQTSKHTQGRSNKPVTTDKNQAAPELMILTDRNTERHRKHKKINKIESYNEQLHIPVVQSAKWIFM